MLVRIVLNFFSQLLNLAINIHKYWFELLFVTQFLWLGFANKSFFWNSYPTNDDADCDVDEVNLNVWPLCWLTQFSILGSELWLCVLSMDIHISLTNPFVSYSTNVMYYNGLVYGLSIFTATLLVIVRPVQFGLSNEPMIWINSSALDGFFAWTKIAFFYVFIFFILSYSIVIAFWARGQIHKGLQETLAIRLYSVNKQTTCEYSLSISIVSTSDLTSVYCTYACYRCDWLCDLLECVFPDLLHNLRSESQSQHCKN